MGVREFISSKAESVKRNAPDATPLKNAFATAYSYSSAALTKIDQAVRNNAPSNLGQFIPDDETISKIGQFATTLAKNAALYAFQEMIPGAAAISYVLLKTLNDVKGENLTTQKPETSAEQVGTPQKLETSAEQVGTPQKPETSAEQVDTPQKLETSAEKVGTPQKHSSGGRKLAVKSRL